MAVSKRLRYEILRRDNHTCRYCGATAPEVKLTVDHVIPTALGGTDEPANLVCACEPCNSGKSATPPGAPLVADVAEDALRWAAAMKFVAKQQVNDIEQEMKMSEMFTEIWTDWENYFGTEYHRPLDWRQSIAAMRRAGAGYVEVAYAINTAVLSKATAENKWRYFCGVVWRGLTERQRLAAELIASQEGLPS